MSEDSDFDRRNDNAEYSSVLFWPVFYIFALVVLTTALYFAKDVLMPLTLAAILSVVLSPLTDRLEPVLGRLASAALVVILGFGAIAYVTYFLTVEFTNVADEVASYSDNIGDKLARLQTSTPVWLQHVEEGVAEIQQRLQRKHGHAAPQKNIQPVVASPSFPDELKPFTPVAEAIVEILMIVVLVFFLLYSRRDLRDRFVRLAARSGIVVASEAMEAAGHTVGRYLLLFSLINLSFGVTTGLAVWLLGLPNAALWGLVAFLFRFIPYVGAIMASVFPALVAFALFPGWSRSLEILGSFLFLDQIAGQFLEPFIIGPGIGVSPPALLVSAMYWSWLWGIPGLLLATPITACLKVAGDHLPALNFMSLMLGETRKLEDYHDFYRMLLELDDNSARLLAISYCVDYGLEATFDHILIPAIRMSGKEHAAQHASDETQQFVVTSIRDLIRDLGRLHNPRERRGFRVLGICPPEEVHDLGLLMLLELCREAGAATLFIDSRTVREALESARGFDAEMVMLSCSLPDSLGPAAELIRTLKAESPQLRVICGGVAAFARRSELLRAGAHLVCATRSEIREVIRRLATERSRSRSRITMPTTRVQEALRTPAMAAAPLPLRPAGKP
jgi:predicted PurR-regulated permease PerM/methylmalonyl-CoA mutase cobalamin-binding subunit